MTPTMKKLFLFVFVSVSFLSFINLSYSQTVDDSTKKNDVNVQVAPVQDVCPVSGMAIEPGSGVEYSYLGTKYKFCCNTCMKKFKAEPMDYIKGEVKCPVSGETASRDQYTVIDDVKYYFCCAHCKDAFEKEPQKYLNKDGSK